MSDVSQGPGWWLASDGRWYRPEQHPEYGAESPIVPISDPTEYVASANKLTREMNALTKEVNSNARRKQTLAERGGTDEERARLEAEMDLLKAEGDRLATESDALDARSPKSGWWSGITRHVVLNSCHFSGSKDRKEMGMLWATELCIEYKGPPIFGTKVSCTWAGIADIEIIESQIHHGSQRSAVGIGPIGLAVVGATMLHNRNAAHIDTVRVIRVTNNRGEQFHFVPKNSSPKRMAPIVAIIERLRTYQTTIAPPPPPSVDAPIAYAPSVADELQKLAALRDSGVLSEGEFATQKAKLLS